MGAEEPERTLRLNVRAILQSLRLAGWEVQETSIADQELKAGQEHDGGKDDVSILDPKGNIRGWISVASREGGEGESGRGEGVVGQMQRAVDESTLPAEGGSR